MTHQIGTRRIDEVGRFRSRQYDWTLGIGALSPMVEIDEIARRTVAKFEMRGLTT
jgi:hypothetical protein